MQDLFGQPTQRIPKGFSYADDFITPAQEQQLITTIQEIVLHPMVFQGYVAKRKVKSFGYDYNFENRSLKKGEPIPEKFFWLIEQVAMHVDEPFENFTELLVTEYPVGSVINWHRDAPPFDIIVGISLGADCIFKLKPHDPAKQTRKATLSFPVRPRSLYVIRDEARTEWQHSISPVKEIRYSITLRTLRKYEG